MVKILELIKEGNELYGITDRYLAIKLNPGDKFRYNGKPYRTGHEGNYMADFPWWEYCWLTRKLADIFIGKRDYDY
jgi:hypothetical protein